MAGNGKSQTVVAIAAAAVASGESVLVATKADAAVDALVDLLDQAPGLAPVVFGGSDRRDALARRLSDGLVRGVDPATVRGRREEWVRAERAYDDAATEIGRMLTADAAIHQRVNAPTLRALADADSPAALAALAGRVALLLHDADRHGRGWRAGRRQRAALAALATLVGADAPVSPTEVRDELALARVRVDAGSLLAGGGLDLSDEWRRLETLDDIRRAAAASWLAAETGSARRLDRAGLGAVGAFATSLRAGRASRRALLERIDHRLTTALPLWVGTLADIDDLLPGVPSLFDLVILDEAAGIEQALAAPALLRASRAVVVGDPRQLRHVSFVADATITGAVEHHLVHAATAALLNVRRNSIFDVAATASPVVELDEHFRSAPHLVEFACTRLYDRRVSLATRSPATTGVDCIEVVRVAGRRDADDVVRAEVDRVISLLQDARRFGARSVGVVSPFRAQSDALESAILAAFTADDLEALDLRVGTVHAFQGNERDHVIVSLGVGPDQDRAWQFVGDRHLLAVLVTRARLRLTIVHSADPPAGGLLAEYLAQADGPPGPPQPAGPVAPWTRRIVDALADAGVEVIEAYPVGRHLIDACAISGSTWLGLECAMHPDGPAAHLARHLELRRAGWPLLDAYESRWGAPLGGTDRLGELVVEILGELRSGRAVTS